ncbi:MAG: hypothetical protein ACXWRE_08005 [Pseudobdellovibrionaceae bacterium]
MVFISKEKQKRDLWTLPLNFIEKRMVSWHHQGRLFMSPKLSNQKMWARQLINNSTLKKVSSR